MSFGFGRSRTALCCALLALFTQTSAAAQRGPGAARRRPAPPQASLPAGLPPEVAAAGPAVLLHEDAEGRADRRLLSLAGSAGGGFAALWSDLRHGTPVVYVRRFGRGGEALGDERPVRESYSAVMELVPSLALGPEGQAAIAYQLERDPVGPRAFRVRRLDPDGSFPDGGEIVGSKQGWVRTKRSGPEPEPASAEFWPRTAIDGLGRVHALWNYDGHVLLQELGGELRRLDPDGPPALGCARLVGAYAGPALAAWSTDGELRAVAFGGPDPAPVSCGRGDLLEAVSDPRPGLGFWLLVETEKRAVLRPLDARGRVCGDDVAPFDGPPGNLALTSWSEGLAILRQARPGKPHEGLPGGPFLLHLLTADGSAAARPPMIVSTAAPDPAVLTPLVAGAGDRLLVAWSERRDSGLEVYGRLLRAGGLDLEPEFPLAGARATSNQSHPAAASVTDRRAVAVWVDERSGSAGLYGRLITAAGDPMGVEFPVPMRLNGEPLESGPCSEPEVAMGPAGDFAVTWFESERLVCQAFRSDTRPRRAPETVAAGVDPARGQAVTRQESYRSWLCAWVAPGGVMVRRVRGDGEPLAEPMAVSGPGPVAHPALLELSGERVVVAWDAAQAGGARLHARILEPELHASTEVLDLPLPPRGAHTGPLLAPAPGGGFLLAWTAELSPDETVVVARQYDRSGQPAGDPVQLSELPGRETGLALTVLADGSWLLGWEASGPQGTRAVVRRLRPGSGEPGPARVLDPPAGGYRPGGSSPALVGVEGGWLGFWVDAHRGAGLDVWCRAVGRDFDLDR